MSQRVWLRCLWEHQCCDGCAPPVSDVPDSYDGPRFDGEDITLEFVKDTMEHFKAQKLIHKKYVVKILIQLIKQLKSLPSLLEVWPGGRAPLLKTEGTNPFATAFHQVDVPAEGSKYVSVCGDTHGQYYDTLNIFEKNGLPSPSNPYIFNGANIPPCCGLFVVRLLLTAPPSFSSCRCL